MSLAYNEDRIVKKSLFKAAVVDEKDGSLASPHASSRLVTISTLSVIRLSEDGFLIKQHH